MQTWLALGQFIKNCKVLPKAILKFKYIHKIQNHIIISYSIMNVEYKRNNSINTEILK